MLLSPPFSVPPSATTWGSASKTVDTLGVILVGAGAYMVYAGYKGEHPWTLFLDALKANSGNPNAVKKPVLV